MMSCVCVCHVRVNELCTSTRVSPTHMHKPIYHTHTCTHTELSIATEEFNDIVTQQHHIIHTYMIVYIPILHDVIYNIHIYRENHL